MFQRLNELGIDFSIFKHFKQQFYRKQNKEETPRGHWTMEEEEKKQ